MQAPPSSLPHSSSTETIEALLASGVGIYQRFHCMTLGSLKRFVRDVGLEGPHFTSVDVAQTLIQMTAEHQRVALSKTFM